MAHLCAVAVKLTVLTIKTLAFCSCRQTQTSYQLLKTFQFSQSCPSPNKQQLSESTGVAFSSHPAQHLQRCARGFPFQSRAQRARIPNQHHPPGFYLPEQKLTRDHADRSQLVAGGETSRAGGLPPLTLTAPDADITSVFVIPLKQEDDTLRQLVNELGSKKWAYIASKLGTKGPKQVGAHHPPPFRAMYYGDEARGSQCVQHSLTQSVLP